MTRKIEIGDIITMPTGESLVMLNRDYQKEQILMRVFASKDDALTFVAASSTIKSLEVSRPMSQNERDD